MDRDGDRDLDGMGLGGEQVAMGARMEMGWRLNGAG